MKQHLRIHMPRSFIFKENTNVLHPALSMLRTLLISKFFLDFATDSKCSSVVPLSKITVVNSDERSRIILFLCVIFRRQGHFSAFILCLEPYESSTKEA